MRAAPAPHLRSQPCAADRYVQKNQTHDDSGDGQRNHQLTPPMRGLRAFAWLEGFVANGFLLGIRQPEMCIDYSASDPRLLYISCQSQRLIVNKIYKKHREPRFMRIFRRAGAHGLIFAIPDPHNLNKEIGTGMEFR
jgi:hypothetical protein